MSNDLNTVTDLVMNRLAAHRELIEELKTRVAKLESQVAMMDPIGRLDEDEDIRNVWVQDEHLNDGVNNFMPLDDIYQPLEEDDSED